METVIENKTAQFRENLKEAINHKLIETSSIHPERISYKT